MGGMFGGGSPSIPKPPPPVPMADEDAVARERRRAAAGLQKRGGRASTVLSEADKESLGG
jgi:hypothetical protein